ncbi:MAG: hypothetical protein HOQ44_02210 [Nocardia sp.]|nr:hypothetical protein [Nocardia sp.]
MFSGRTSRKVAGIAHSLAETLTDISAHLAGSWRRRSDTAAAGAKLLDRRGAEPVDGVPRDDRGQRVGRNSELASGDRPLPAPEATAAHIARTGWAIGPMMLRTHTTDKGVLIPPRTLMDSVSNAPVDTDLFISRAGLSKLFAQNIAGGVRLDRLESLGPIIPHYNCHGYTFSRDGAAGFMSGRMVDGLLADNGFRRVDDLGAVAPGDVVIYRKNGVVQHSGVVAGRYSGAIHVDSKQGPLSLVRHRIDEVTGFYGSDVTVYRTDRPEGRFLTPVENSDEPAPPWPPPPRDRR